MIRIGKLPPSPLEVRKLASLRRVVVAAPSYLAQRGRPQVPADLARHACIVRTSAQDARAWTFQGPDGATERVVVAGSFESDSAYVTNHAVLAGMGIAIAPFFHLRDAIEGGEAEILLDEYLLAPVPVHAVWPADVRTLARLRRFVELLAARLRKEIV
jgi:DNA-binding transcriptional LysR family regulator